MQTEAIDKIAEKFARSLVVSILEGFLGWPGAAGRREDSLLAGYLFFGEEEYLAEEFVEELGRVLTASAGGEFHLTRLDLDEAKWRGDRRHGPDRAVPVRALAGDRRPRARAQARLRQGSGPEGRRRRGGGPGVQVPVRDRSEDPEGLFRRSPVPDGHRGHPGRPRPAGRRLRPLLPIPAQGRPCRSRR